MLKRLRTIMVFVTYQHLNGNKRLTNSKPTKSGTLPNIIHVMSQMILFTYKKPNNLFFGIENNLYFKEYAKVLFHTNCTDGIYTIPNFDSLCVCAQKSIGNGISINQTELFKVLQWIQNEEIYMWYGAECDDLDCIENFETLINAISNGLLTSSGELYIHYKKSNKK